MTHMYTVTCILRPHDIHVECYLSTKATIHVYRATCQIRPHDIHVHSYLSSKASSGPGQRDVDNKVTSFIYSTGTDIIWGCFRTSLIARWLRYQGNRQGKTLGIPITLSQFPIPNQLHHSNMITKRTQM